MRAKAWSNEEHLLFLKGLNEFGKGKWKDISTHYVKTRSCIQVASHAQKYFIRCANKSKKKNRKSMFDNTVICKPQPVSKILSINIIAIIASLYSNIKVEETTPDIGGSHSSFHKWKSS
jgi:SHAQKYF class myb-like DNA-binding protein